MRAKHSNFTHIIAQFPSKRVCASCREIVVAKNFTAVARIQPADFR